MSKGSSRRPTDEAKFASNYDRIFRKKKNEDTKLKKKRIEARGKTPKLRLVK